MGLAWGTVAHAQEPARTRAAARALFDEGVACVDRQDWACAADRFGRARALRSSPVILSNHAVALRHVGRWVEAAEAFRALASDPAASATSRQDAARQARALEAHLGRVRVEVTGDREGATLTMDGAPLEPSLVGVAIPADPGAHTLRAHRDGAVVAEAQAEVGEGAEVALALYVPPAPRAMRVAPIETGSLATIDETSLDPRLLGAPRERPREVYEEWWLWTIVGVVVVGAGIGVTLAVVETSQGATPSGSLGTIDLRP